MSKEPPLPVKSLPSPIRHSHILKAQNSDGCAGGGGRILSYYTFAAGVEESELRKYHPIIYLHGFPGSGLEGALFASSAAKSRCQLFGIDRPGFGYSSPSPSADWNNPDAYMQSFVSDVWDFVRAMEWKSFSIIGVSGGGPYALAILDSYLRSKLDGCSVHVGHAVKCNLEAVSIVAGVFGTAGSDGMMPSNQKLMTISSLRGWKSSLAHFGLIMLVSIQRFILLNILLRIFSEKRLLKMATEAMKGLPDCDKQAFLEDEAIGLTFLGDAKEALRQSAASTVLETKVLFRKGYHFEQSLKENWATTINGTKPPRVTLFQGHRDVNVPPSHSQFVHENIFGGDEAGMVEFDDMGHLSLVIKKADEVLKSIART